MVVAADAQVHSLDTMFPLTVLNRSIEKKPSVNVDETHVTCFNKKTPLVLKIFFVLYPLSLMHQHDK